MMDGLDINIIPLYRQDGRDRSNLPGVHIAEPPRGAARGRKSDRLVVFISFLRPVSVPREQVTRVSLAVEKAYFEKPGTVTSAVREVVEELNETFLSRNVRQPDSSKHIIAALSLLVIREGNLILAQSGPSHGILIQHNELEYLHDAQAAGRGLGLSRIPAVRFYQSPLQSGTLLVVTPKVPSSWNEGTFAGVSGQPVGSFQRKLLSDAGDELQAILLHARAGKGKLNLAQTAPTEGEAHSQAAARPIPQETPAHRPAHPPAEVGPAPQRPVPDSPVKPAPMTRPPTQPIKPSPKRTPRQSRDWRADLFRIGRQAAEQVSAVLVKLQEFLARVLPTEEISNLPTSVMVFTAVAVPLVVVSLAAVVYLRLGRTQQYEHYLGQAVAAVETAQSAKDWDDQRAAWVEAVSNLDIAERYSVTDDTQTLREKSQSALDQIDGIIRMEFRPAIAGSLPASTKIRRMVATGRDIFMLDVSDGTVLRAWLTGTGYEVDPDFRCGPGKYGPIIVGKIVDIAPLPRTNQDSPPLVALDVNGTLLYCQPEQSPLAVQLSVPDSNWGEPTAITVESERLYVLDPLTNAVWMYIGEEDQFRDVPRLFFITEVPNLNGAIDIAVNRDDLYILYSDGHIVTCNYSRLQEAPTHCSDPAEYVDNRPGKQSGRVLEDARFFQVFHTQPPEPSLYFLDPIARSIFQFSLRLNLVQQYRPQVDLPEGLATAFAVSPTRSVFLALENKIYIGFLP